VSWKDVADDDKYRRLDMAAWIHRFWLALWINQRLVNEALDENMAFDWSA
jgi:hypothetical protein